MGERVDVIMLPLNYFLFTQIILFLFITPGSPRVLIVSYAMRYGMKKTVWTALGDISANTIQMIIIVSGVGSLLLSYPQILSVMKWLGITYLLYLAYGLIQSQSKKISIEKTEINKNTFSFFKDGLSSGSNLTIVLVNPCIIAPACPVNPPPLTVHLTSYSS